MKSLFLLLLAATSVFALSVSTPHEAANLVYSHILDSKIEDRSVLSYPEMLTEGQTVTTWNTEMDVPFDSWLILIDDKALANWEHKCRWIFVSPDGNTEIFHMTTPPDFLPKMTIDYTSLPEYSPGRSNLLDWFVSNPRNTDVENCKALIISGGANSGNNHERYYGDVQFLYLTLTQDYGYTNDDIIICFADGLNPNPDQSGGVNSNPDLDGDGVDDFDYDATLGSVTNALAEMATLAGPEDHVLIYTTDHGGNGKYGPPEVFLNLWNSETLNDDTFDTFIDTFDCASLHVVMEQCYSGGFGNEVIPATGQEDRTFGSAANAYESSWAGATYPEYDEWVYWWTGAMHGSTPPGGSYPGGPVPYDPDANTDGFVDYGEAWDCAYVWDSYAQSGQEHPQYDDDPDSCGSLYWLGGAIPSPGIENSEGLSLPVTGNLTISVNPVSAVASVIFSLGESVPLELAVYDIGGRVVDVLLDGELSAGEHSIVWNTGAISSGVYIIRLHARNQILTARAVKF